MAERRTAKERVLAKWPAAYAERGMGAWVVRHGHQPHNAEIGRGLTEDDAWQDAASKLSTKGK